MTEAQVNKLKVIIGKLESLQNIGKIDKQETKDDLAGAKDRLLNALNREEKL